MEQAKRVAKNTGFLYARMAITVFISLYVTRVLLLALGEKDFGLFNVVGGMIAMLVFLNGAMTTASQRFMSFSHGKGDILTQKQIFNSSVILHLIIGLVLIVFIELIGLYMINNMLDIDIHRMDAARLIFHFMVISTFFSVNSVPYDAVLNAHENMFFIAILGVVESILKLCIALYVSIYDEDRLILFGGLTLLISIVLFFIKKIYTGNNYEEVIINPREYLDKKIFKEMSNFAGWSFLGSSSSMISLYGQGILLNMFFGTVINASQAIATQISGQLTSLSRTMLMALNPIIAKNEGAGERELMLRISVIGSKLSLFLLLIFFIPVFIELPYIFNFWLDEVPKYSIIFCKLLMIRNLVDQPFVTLASSIKAVGSIKLFQISISIINFIPLIISAFLFTMEFEPYYMYIVFLLFSVLRASTIVYFAKKFCNLQVVEFIKNVIGPGLLSIFSIYILSMIPNFLMEEGVIRLMAVILTSIIAYSIIIWVVGLSEIERNYLKKLVIKR